MPHITKADQWKNKIHTDIINAQRKSTEFCDQANQVLTNLHEELAIITDTTNACDEDLLAYIRAFTATCQTWEKNLDELSTLLDVLCLHLNTVQTLGIAEISSQEIVRQKVKYKNARSREYRQEEEAKRDFRTREDFPVLLQERTGDGDKGKRKLRGWYNKVDKHPTVKDRRLFVSKLKKRDYVVTSTEDTNTSTSVPSSESDLAVQLEDSESSSVIESPDVSNSDEKSESTSPVEDVAQVTKKNSDLSKKLRRIFRKFKSKKKVSKSDANNSASGTKSARRRWRRQIKNRIHSSNVVSEDVNDNEENVRISVSDVDAFLNDIIIEEMIRQDQRERAILELAKSGSKIPVLLKENQEGSRNKQFRKRSEPGNDRNGKSCIPTPARSSGKGRRYVQ